MVFEVEMFDLRDSFDLKAAKMTITRGKCTGLCSYATFFTLRLFHMINSPCGNFTPLNHHHETLCDAKKGGNLKNILSEVHSHLLLSEYLFQSRHVDLN